MCNENSWRKASTRRRTRQERRPGKCARCDRRKGPMELRKKKSKVFWISRTIISVTGCSMGRVAFADRADFLAQLERIRPRRKTKIQFLLQRIGVLIAAHADIAGSQRGGAAHDVDEHDAGSRYNRAIGSNGAGS